MGDYKRLKVWERAHKLTCVLYDVTRSMAQRDRFVLGDQILRATISIGANIAEGCGRGSDPDARRHFQIALGSACEALSLGLLARDLGLLTSDAFDALERQLAPVRRMLVRLIQRTRRANPR